MKSTLGILLNFGDSFVEYKKSGRDSHWLNNYLKFYPQTFQPVYVFSYANEVNPYPELIKLLPNRYNLPRWLYVWLLPFFYFKEFRQCRVLRVKQMLGVWPALMAKWLWQIPVVTTYGYDYAHFAVKEGKWWLAPWIKLIEWFGWRFSDRIIVTTPNNKARSVLIPNGVDTNLFKPVRRRMGKIINILNVGRLVHQKNQFALIRAVTNLKTPAELTIVGRGPLRQEIVVLAKKLKVNLRLIPSLPHNQLAAVYQAADIFCLPSHYEGSPKVLLEAMSCGLPCVVANKPYGRFIITNNRNGLLIENQVKPLTDSINQLIKSSALRRRLGLFARKTILKRFDNRQVIAKEVGLLKSFIK